MNGNLSEMGQYIAEKRAEKGLTQQQLADRLHVTNKAVSKWETGRGLPDIQMLEPLSEALGVTPAELLRCGRPEPEAATVREALQYSEKRTREKIFRRIGWALVALGLLVGGGMLPFLITDLQRLSMYDSTLSVIGGADGPDVDSGSRGVCLARMARVSAAGRAAYRRAFVYPVLPAEKEITVNLAQKTVPGNSRNQ